MLSRRFAPKERITAYRVQFNSRIRKKNESLSDYGYALGRLNFELQKRVQFSHPLTLESAIAIAIEYEAFVGSTSMTSEIKKPKEPQIDIGVNAVEKVENRVYKEENKDLTEFTKSVMNSFQELNKRIDELRCDKSDTEELPEHLKCMLEKVSSKLSKEQKEKIKRLIFNFQDIFLGPEGKLGRTELVKHTIDTGDARPIRIPPRRVALAQKDIISEEIEKC
ncbi:unnamed protein product [Mytilus edulis]|uniref:Uncharacterized protein n=1 Tax=Mytilus edulis TaxID=6550 RepID=A0A8S3TXV7_MYTED|nr:unnamed protein product [Mytilus edulis]